MKLPIADYATLIFDCDGVVLDSNKVKTEAFRQAALPYGTDAAVALVAHHISNGGVSRYKKFQHFLDEIVQPGQKGPDLEALLGNYAAAVREGLMTCAIADGLRELRSAYPGQRWLIVSGGDQAELREIFAARDLVALFDGGIFGSPDTKEKILAREIESGNVRQPALFLGDSTYDHRVSHGAGLDFIFVFGWTELPGWGDYTSSQLIRSVESLECLTAHSKSLPLTSSNQRNPLF